MTALKKLLASMTPQQQAAINLIRLSLDCFNSKDGSGLFAGAERYRALASRVEICAVQAESLPGFWALLLRRMQWPVPPKSADESIVVALSADGGDEVLRVLATETASVITLARMLHDQDKTARRALCNVQTADDCAFFDDEVGNQENLS